MAMETYGHHQEKLYVTTEMERHMPPVWYGSAKITVGDEEHIFVRIASQRRQGLTMRIIGLTGGIAS